MVDSTTSGTAVRPDRLASGASASEPVPFESRTPDLGSGKERVIRGFAIFTLLYGVAFLAWRWSSTLNPDALWIAVPLAITETAVLLTTALLVFNVWRLRRRTPPPVPDGLDVDVFITTYDEPLEIIRKTVLGARAIRYPHRTYVLDDGRRFEVRALARELGVGYITRNDNRHAKAGNLNNALRLTSGDFILQLDADHVPLPHILDRLLGYAVADARVAFVQSPQNFYNTDSFSTHVQPETRRLLTDQNIFFDVIQPGKDHRNAAFFCGSCGVLRRAAIEQIGGFSTETITEDIETSLLLHARGWRSVYHNEPLAYGLAPRTATAFHIQRLRWGQGGMQLLRRFNPLTTKGLSPAQRLCYFASALHSLDGVLRLVFFLTPLLYLLTGALPIRTLNVEFFARFVPYIGSLLLLHHLLSRGTGGPLWYVEYSSMAKFFTHTIATAALLTRKRLRFRVTPKGLNGVSWASYAPHAALMGVTLGAVVWGVAAFRLDWITYGPDGEETVPFLVNVAWASWNFAMAALVLRTTLASHQRRPDHRFEDVMPVRYTVAVPRAEPPSQGGVSASETESIAEDTGAASAPSRDIAVTENLNAKGLAFRALAPIAIGARVALELPLTTEPVQVSGRVVHRRPVRAGRIQLYSHGIAFDALPQAAADVIEMHCTQHAVPVARYRYVERADPFDMARRAVRDPRREGRQPLLLPVEVVSEAGRRLGVLEETSRRGARFLLDRPIERGAAFAYRVPGTPIEAAALAVFCRELNTPFGSRFVVGARHASGKVDDALFIDRQESNMRKVAMLAGLVTAVRRFGFVIGIGAGALAAAGHAHAQIAHGLVTGADRASDGQTMVLLGGWLGGSGLGWSPVVGAIGYRLEVPDGGGPDVASVSWAGNPFVGARRQWPDAGIQLNLGYSFQQTDDDDLDPGAGPRVSSGLTTGAQADWGMAGPLSVQLMVTHSWDEGGYTWSRARLGRRVAGGASEVRIGAELSAQGGETYRALELGPTLEWRVASGVAVGASGGWRRADDRSGAVEDLGYLRVELVLVGG